MKFSTLFIFIWSILSCFSGYSQSTANPYKERCKYLDKSVLTTHHLANHTWPMTYLPLLKGTTNDSIDVDIFKQLYFDLKITEVGNSTLPDFEIFKETIRSYNKLFTIPMGLIYQNFNHFKPNAVEDEWLLLEDGYYVRSPDYTGPLYDEATTFAMAPLRGSSHFFAGKPITFIFPNNLIFNGTNHTINQYEIDFGDGNGFQTIMPDSQTEVQYGSAGNKTLTLRATTDTETLYTVSSVLLTEVHAANTATGLLAAGGEDGLCYPDKIEEFSTPPLTKCGVYQSGARALAYIRYANPDNPKITKPVIFVEGLDLGERAERANPNTGEVIRHGDFGWDVLTTGIGPDPKDKENLVPIKIYKHLPDLVDNFTDDGYDLILLDFADGAGLIQQNSQLLIKLIEWVNLVKEGCEQNVVIGASMGGMIARYALATMEQTDKNHDTRLYASFDAPHQGVNIPIGIQALMKSVHDGFNFIEGAREPLEKLQRPAPKQLVLHHIDENNCLREDFVSEMDALGYPENCRKVAIVSGSNQGIGGEQAPAPGTKMLDFNLISLGLPNPLFASFFELDIEIIASERKDYVGTQDVLDANLTIQSIWGFPAFPISIFINGTGDHHIEPSQYGELSSLPGGKRNTIEESLTPILEKVEKWFPLAAQALPGINIPYTHLQSQGQHSFTPSISALDVNTDDPYFDLEGNITPNNLNFDLTPFDAYYSQPENLQHVEVSEGVRDWTREESSKNRADLANVLSETYNYGHIKTLLPEVTITSIGVLRINDNGPTGYVGSNNEGDVAEQDYFHVYTHEACGGDITVEDGGQFILGSEEAPYQHGVVHVQNRNNVIVEAGGTLAIKRRSHLILERGSHLELSGLLEARFGGQVIIKDGASLRVADGGTLRMVHSSNVVVEEGGLLIIEEGANINLWDNNNHRARIEVAGHLLINGLFGIGGTGHFKFNKGNKVTFGSGISEFAFNGNAQDHRFFLLGENASLDLGEMPFILSRGIIEYEPGSSIYSKGARYAQFLALNLNGIHGGGTALTTRGVEEVSFRYCNFTNLQTGLNSLNERMGTVNLQNCDFEKCRYGLFSIGHQRVDVYNSNFSGEGLEIGMAALLAGNQNVSMTSTNVVDYNGPAYRNDYELGDHQEGINHPAISLSHDEGITNLSMYDCFIANNKIGVLLEEGSNEYSDGNIFVRDRTTFQENETGILMWRGRHHEANAGLVLLDCARMIDNGVGVKGIDVLLQMDAEENCLECAGNPNTQIRPNTLIAPYEFDGPANIFDICYKGLYPELEDIQIPAKGNFWRTIPNLPHVPQGGMWRFTRNDNCSGYVPDDVLDETGYLSTEPTSCPDETPDDDCPPGEICVVNPPDDKRVIVEIEGNLYNLHSQYAAAYQDFRNENITRSQERFMPIAGIPDEVKKNLSGVGRHYVDVARVMVNAFRDSNKERPDEAKGKGRSIDTYEKTYGHLWLSGNKQTIGEEQAKPINFSVYPNPASDQVMVEAAQGSYELSVYDILGSLIYRTIIDGRTNLEVANWQKGLYTIELKEMDNLENSMIQKLIIQ